MRPRLQDRIVLFFVAMLVLVQLASFHFIRQAIEATARDSQREELRVGARVLRRLLDQNSQQLVDATSILTYEPAFREAVARRDGRAILAALRNHAERVHASGMALIGLDGVVIADTLDPRQAGRPFANRELLVRAGSSGRTSGVRVVDSRAVQSVVVPVLSPEPIAWASMDFVIDDRTAGELQRLSSSEVSFVGLSSGKPALLATTLLPPQREPLLRNASRIVEHGMDGITVPMGEEDFEAIATPLDDPGGPRIHAILQRSVAEGIAPYLALQAALLFIAGISLAITLVGSMRIARQVTRPVAQLADAARQITRGNYRVRVPDASRDELGDLARAFNGMAEGLAELDNMRDVLGKVASTDVMKQMLKGGEIELGGQELDASVMFTDVRNFTALCEKLTPQQSLALLNEFLTVISAVVERHGGVVDKFIGDGVMAVFGAPVTRHDDPQRAVEAALEIRERVSQLRPSLAARGMPDPEIGLGLNTSRVVAGNIGSPSRLNYTVLGDGVNLASRLEGLTKRYHVPIVVGCRTRDSVRGIVFRELDKVRVKGKSVAERIFEPIGREGELATEELERLARWNAALQLFRERRWAEARSAFEPLASLRGYERLVWIYMGYVRDLLAHPPGEDWDAAFTLYEK